MTREPLVERLVKPHPARDGTFRWRGDGVSRIEGLSDAVFGFAITLLVVTLDPPRTFDDLLGTLVGFPAFAAAFTLLVLIWAAQYKFFRRYGLEDTRTVVLNVALLFLVVFFVYPLKYLFTTFIGLWLGIAGRVFAVPALLAQAEAANRSLRGDQWPAVMAIYGLGYAGVFAVFVLLHRHAFACADALALDASERLETRYSVLEHKGHIAVALASVALTLGLAYGAGWPAAPAAGVGGFAYVLEWPLQTVLASRLAAQRRALRPVSAAPLVSPS